MKIKTSELIGSQLDWAVAKALDIEPELMRVSPSGVYTHDFGWFTPSTDWSQAGPIIERKSIGIEPPTLPLIITWRAYRGRHFRFGPTPLIAAMRCYVFSRLGDEVEVSDELVGSP